MEENANRDSLSGNEVVNLDLQTRESLQQVPFHPQVAIPLLCQKKSRCLNFNDRLVPAQSVGVVAVENLVVDDLMDLRVSSPKEPYLCQQKVCVCQSQTQRL